MGPNTLGEFGKPKKHTWVEKGLEEGRFGEKGAGIESAAAGGLHTIFVDEAGKVHIPCRKDMLTHVSDRYGPVELVMMLHWGDQSKTSPIRKIREIFWI
jgi:hypothetical protein